MQLKLDIAFNSTKYVPLILMFSSQVNLFLFCLKYLEKVILIL